MTEIVGLEFGIADPPAIDLAERKAGVELEIDWRHEHRPEFSDDLASGRDANCQPRTPCESLNCGKCSSVLVMGGWHS
jgi:hypothetical protein